MTSLTRAFHELGQFLWIHLQHAAGQTSPQVHCHHAVHGTIVRGPLLLPHFDSSSSPTHLPHSTKGGSENPSTAWHSSAAVAQHHNTLQVPSHPPGP